MSFAINPSLTYIDIPDANILEIYRSKGQVQLSDTRFRGHPCEAFICVAKVEKKVTARVALLETVMNSIFVYTSALSAEQPADYPTVLAEALDFTTSFGFTMEKVNLEFSPAMKEVIIKGIRVMRPPLKKTKLRSLNSLSHLEQSAPEPPAAVVSSAAKSSEEKSAEQAEVRRLKTELSSSRALIEEITLEKQALESSASREIAALKSAAEKAAEAEKLAIEKLTKELETLKSEKQAKDVRQHDERIQQLESALDKAESARKALEDKISRLTAKIETIENEKVQLAHDLSTEKSSSAANISNLTAEIASINALLTAEKSAVADKISELAHFEASLRESQDREDDLCRNLDIMKEQVDQLEAELEKLRQQEGGKEDLLLKIVALEKETAAAKATIEELASNNPDCKALQEELKSLAEAKNDVESEYIRMANEAMEKESEMLATLYSADAQILKLSRDLELCRQAAESEKAALRDELSRMTVAGADTLTRPDSARSSESTVAAPSSLPDQKTGQQKKVAVETEQSAKPAAPSRVKAAPSVTIIESLSESDSAEDETPDEPINAEDEIMAGLLNEFGSFCISSGHSATEFTLDPDIRSIEYADPAEVLAILYSSNTVQAVPDGKSVQRCKGYVIALKKSGEYSVYLVWFMPESGKVVICTPEQQPADAAECTQIIQDAVSYFEIVGFMMEVEELGGTVKSYNRAIRKVPALSRI